VKTYEEAKDEVRKQWLEEKGREEMKKAADEAHKKIKEALAAKKSFADAAKEAGLSAITIDPFGNGENPAGHPDAQALFTAAQYTTPGELTEVVTTTDGSAIAVVDKREIVKDPNFDSMLSGGVDQTKRSIRIQAFQAWINERYELAKIQ
jgi:parvulin-like peptidyl-prolyl isomerase